MGLDPAAGERVRRKLKRLGDRYTERSAAHVATTMHRPAAARAQGVLR
ncbi:hypothetical protein E4N62_19975 [Streptomyces sp. MNU76]|nr:hypothetical protein [Streptomyces sp. MNU76]MCC9707358.1 hypothetical protein [Streptomyces sp. MNU76]